MSVAPRTRQTAWIALVAHSLPAADSEGPAFPLRRPGPVLCDRDQASQREAVCERSRLVMVRLSS